MKETTQLDVNSASGADKRIPVTLLTGFLGAGKTTLLNNLLRHPGMAGAAVLINEFGEVGIDHHLVDKVDETMLILDSGCICCSVQGDLVKALRNLAERSSKREIPKVTRVVIETTGLADPVPVIYTLTQERFVAARYRCDGVITAVDALHALRQLDHHDEAVRQVAMADRLLITKCDLADATSRTALEGRLDALNPAALRIEAHHGRINPDVLFGCGIYSDAGRLANIAAWLGEKEGHATHRHDHSVSSFVVSFGKPVPWYGFAVTMGRILQAHGYRILRVKGIMNIAGDSLPRVIHCVQDTAYPPFSLTSWPDQSPFDDRRGRLVFIVRNLGQEEVEAIRGALSDMQNMDVGRLPGIVAAVLPTMCWLSHNVNRGSTSVIDLDGWVVQPKRLRAK